MAMNIQEKIDSIRTKYEALQSELNERGRRIWAAIEANSLGHGGVVAVAKATGIAESTIRIGKREMKNNSVEKKNETNHRIRKNGGG